ncbi:MAG TPA: hypothetical protein VHM19_20875 [Polyangiales bacterium]|jgi:hypothetical protein|nr:hypothetical protein [Polyangiales bacterium]
MIKLRILDSPRTLDGQAVSGNEETLQAISPKAFPPGKPLELVLLLDDAAGTQVALSGRCIGSKKRDDGAFDLRVRLTNLRREAREQLLAAFREPTAPSS